MELRALKGQLFILKIYDASQHGLVSRTLDGLVAEKRTLFRVYSVLYICPLLFVFFSLSLSVSLSLADSHIPMDRTDLTLSLALVFRR